MSIIELQHIDFSYQHTPVLTDFTLSIENGQITCLLGSSGSGKTTILRLIAGLEIPENGHVLINEKVVSSGKSLEVPPHKRNVGFVFQDLALWPHMTVYKNVAFGLEQNRKKDKEKQVMEILEFFQLSDQKDKFPHQLSGGQKQLVAIARSMVMQPHILLMDEPLANLDVKLKFRILNYIKEIRNRFGTAIVYVTHDHKEAFSIADEIIVLQNGKIEIKGSVEEVIRADNEYVKYFIEL